MASYSDPPSTWVRETAEQRGSPLAAEHPREKSRSLIALPLSRLVEKKTKWRRTM